MKKAPSGITAKSMALATLDLLFEFSATARIRFGFWWHTRSTNAQRGSAPSSGSE
jgi:hypothetical protein